MCIWHIQVNTNERFRNTVCSFVVTLAGSEIWYSARSPVSQPFFVEIQAPRLKFAFLLTKPWPRSFGAL